MGFLRYSSVISSKMTGTYKVLVILVLGALSLANAFNTLVPKNQELIYDYKSFVETGIDLPASFSSQILLHGKLHLQSDDNATWVKLTDLKHHMYNGKINGVDELDIEYKEMPEEMQELMKPFKIVHDEHGKAMGIMTNKDENDYTRNIKRALAAVLQMNVKEVNLKDMKRHHAFMTKEHTIYGPQMAQYTVIPHPNNMVMVQKTYELTQDHMWTFSNEEQGVCDEEYRNPITQNCQREYMIKGDDHVVQFMTASGEIFYSPFNAKSDNQYVLANQTMTLEKQVPVKDHWQIPNEHFDTLMYTYYIDEDSVQHESIVDLTNGRTHVNVEKMIPKVVKLLQDMNQYVDEDNLKMETPNFAKGQAVGQVRNMLAQFTLNDLKKVHTVIKQSHPELRELFYGMVPLVGTTATTMFTKYLLHNFENENMTIEWMNKMLREMPLNVKVPTRKLLTEMEEVLDFDDKKVPDSVLSTAIMAFGSLVHRTVHFEMNYKRMFLMRNIVYVDDDYETKLQHEEKEIKEEIMSHHEKYVKKMFNKMRQTDKVKDHLTYMGVIYNMKLPITAKYVMKALEEQWWPDNFHKVQLLWTLSSVMPKDHDLVYRMLWPMMTDRNEYTEARIVSYYLMMESHPSVERMANIFWFMQDEPCQELYNFHYTYMKNMARSKNPCHHAIQDHCTRFLPHMRPSTHGVSTFDIVDYTDMTYKFGMGLHSTLMNTNDSVTMMAVTKTHVFNRGYDNEVFFVKFHGLENVADFIKMNTEVDKNTVLTEDVIMKLYNNLKNNNDAHITMYRLKKSFIVTSIHVTLNDLPDFKTLVKMMSLDKVFDTKNVESKTISMTYEKYMKTMIPTDMGFLAIRSVMLPLVEKTVARLRMDSKNDIFNMHMDTQYVQWMHAKHGLEFYNPIMDVYHRVHKVHAFDASYPALMDVTFNMAQKSMKLTFRKHKDEIKDRYGLRSHISTRVYMVSINEDAINHLEHMHKSIQDHVVSNGEEYRHNYTIFEKDDMMTGTHFTFMVYDTEEHVSNGTWSHLMNDVMDPRTKSFENPLDYWTVMCLNWNERIMLQPRAGSHGILIRMDPVYNHDITSIDINMRWNYEVNVGEYIYKPGMKLSNRMTYSVKTNEKTLKTWDIYTTWEINVGHTNSKLKMDFTRIIPGQKDYKVCLEGTKKMSNHDVSGKVTVLMSQSGDGKCSTDDAMIDITMTGMKSHEQEVEHHMYDVCEYAMPHFMTRYNTLQCLAEHQTLRKYIYNVKVSNLPTEFKKYILNMWDEIKGYHMQYYNMVDEHTVPVKENSVKMEVIYPMRGEQVDVAIYTPQQMHTITGVPTEMYKWFGIYPDNVMYSPMFMYWHALGLLDHCEVINEKEHVHMHFNEHHEDHKLPTEWTMYVGDNVEHPKQAVFIKKVNEQMAIKMVVESNTMEVHPDENHLNEYKVIVNGKTMPHNQEEVVEDWITCHHLNTLEGSPVVVTMPHTGLHLELHHNATMLNMVMSKLNDDWKGRCKQHN